MQIQVQIQIFSAFLNFNLKLNLHFTLSNFYFLEPINPAKWRLGGRKTLKKKAMRQRIAFFRK